MAKITYSDFEALNAKLRNEKYYKSEYIDKAKEILEQVQKFEPNAYIVLDCDGLDDPKGEYGISINYSRIIIDREKCKIEIWYGWSNKGKFDIYLSSDYTNTKNLSTYEKRDIYNKYNKPNEVGVLNAKKLNDWIEYLEKINEDILSLNESKGDKISEFLKSLEGQPVNWFNDKKSGWMVKNGIEYSFAVLNDGTITQNIRLRAYDNTLETFLQLSDNKFIGK